MRRTLGLMFAMLVVIASAVVGLVVLRHDVTVDVAGPYDSMECGSVYAVVLDGHAQGGGEVRRPDDACVDEARQHIWWAALPAATGLLALGCLSLRWMAVVREAQGNKRRDMTLVQ